MTAAFLEQKTIDKLPIVLRERTTPQLIAGYSLLEVLISLCILSFGLLGFAQAQLLALRNNQIAYLQSAAQARLLSLSEALQACHMANCSMTTMNNEVQVWNNYNSFILPKGQGYLTKNGFQQVITLYWQTADQNRFLSKAKLIIPTFHA